MSARDKLYAYAGTPCVLPESMLDETLDAYRAEVLAKAIGRLRAIPVTCTALTGPVWYGTGWNDAITALEDIADYQKPDDEAYPGELQRLRATALAVRVGMRKDSLAEVKRVMDAHIAWEANATSDSAAPDFFQPGRTYAREHHGCRIEFHVRYVETPPSGTRPVAFGWRTEPCISGWAPEDSDDMDGWTQVTAAGEVSA